MWAYGIQTYTKEAVSCVENIYVCLPNKSTPMSVTDFHPELGDLTLLGLDGQRKFQMLVGMLQWMVTMYKLEIFQWFLR